MGGALEPAHSTTQFMRNTYSILVVEAAVRMWRARLLERPDVLSRPSSAAGSSTSGEANGAESTPLRRPKAKTVDQPLAVVAIAEVAQCGLQICEVLEVPATHARPSGPRATAMAN